MAVYRYISVGVNTSDLGRKVPGSLVLGTIAPAPYVDITASPASKDDLDEYMAGIGYAPFSTDPVDSVANQAGTSILSKVSILNNGSLVGKRSQLNFVSGIVLADDLAGDKVNATPDYGLAGSIANITKAAASAGVSTTLARADHKHDITTDAPSNISTANSEGSSTSLARADHIHNHGNQGGGSLHAVATTLVPGFMSDTDKVKLDGISVGGNLRQTVFKEITVDTTTTSPTFVSLLSQAITIVSGSKLLIFFSAGSSNSANNRIGYFRILIDAVVQRGCSVDLSGAGGGTAAAVSIVLSKSGLAVGSRTVSVEWRCSAGTAQIRPVINPDGEHASLLIQEVSV